MPSAMHPTDLRRRRCHHIYIASLSILQISATATISMTAVATYTGAHVPPASHINLAHRSEHAKMKELLSSNWFPATLRREEHGVPRSP